MSLTCLTRARMQGVSKHPVVVSIRLCYWTCLYRTTVRYQMPLDMSVPKHPMGCFETGSHSSNHGFTGHPCSETLKGCFETPGLERENSRVFNAWYVGLKLVIENNGFMCNFRWCCDTLIHVLIWIHIVWFKMDEIPNITYYAIKSINART